MTTSSRISDRVSERPAALVAGQARHRYVVIDVFKVTEADLNRGAVVLGQSNLLSRTTAECLDCGMAWVDRADAPVCPGIKEGTEVLYPEWRP